TVRVALGFVNFFWTAVIFYDFIILFENCLNNRRLIENLLISLVAQSAQKKRYGRHFKIIFFKKIICTEYKSR
nr:hypothetical protein [bacterium]